MKQKLLNFYNGLETVFKKLDSGKWIENEISKLTIISITVTGNILNLLKNPLVDDLLSCILPPALIAEIPTADAVLLDALNSLMGLQKGDMTPLNDTLTAFVEWLKNQPGDLQNAICQKLAAVFLSLLEGKITVKEAQMYVDGAIHNQELKAMS